MTEKQNTPPSHWHAAGEPDPHALQYDCERADLIMGDLTDDELANGVFMNGDAPLPIEDFIAGIAHSPMAWLTAAKDRIRWLSRRTVKLERQRDQLIESLQRFIDEGKELEPHKRYLWQEARASIEKITGARK